MENDVELSILETIYSSQREQAGQVTQRELARRAGLSLGMTNVLLKRFSEKGWLLIKRANARTISYILTPDGVGEIARKTFGYFKRTARTASVYRDLVDAFVLDRKHSGASTIVLGGASDVDFLFEYACSRHDLSFMKTADIERVVRIMGQSGISVVIGEGSNVPEMPNVRDILVGRIGSSDSR